MVFSITYYLKLCYDVIIYYKSHFLTKREKFEDYNQLFEHYRI